MERTQVIELFKSIKLAYPTFDVSTEKVNLWHDLMQDMPYEVVNRRLKQHILSNEYPPKIAEIGVKPKRINLFLEQQKQWEREGANWNG